MRHDGNHQKLFYKTLRQNSIYCAHHISYCDAFSNRENNGAILLPGESPNQIAGISGQFLAREIFELYQHWLIKSISYN